jgi:hypothetical protein
VCLLCSSHDAMDLASKEAMDFGQRTHDVDHWYNHVEDAKWWSAVTIEPRCLVKPIRSMILLVTLEIWNEWNAIIFQQ